MTDERADPVSRSDIPFVDETRFSPRDLGGLDSIVVRHPAGTFALTPASVTAVKGVVAQRTHLKGVGLDWGCGVGILAIVAARLPSVCQVIGLDIVASNVLAAEENARLNRVDSKSSFFVSDSFDVDDDAGRRALATFKGQVDFIVANPPSSDSSTDGFGFRREVMRGAAEFLRPGGTVLLSVSRQYGLSRVKGLVEAEPRFRYDGVASSTDWVDFDLGRLDLLDCLKGYAEEEERGGLPYAFRDIADPTEDLTAAQALAVYHDAGRSPLSQWQSLVFRLSP